MSKIFVRERRRVGRGEGKPRFVVVAIEGADMRLFTVHLRKTELEALAQSIQAEIVYLSRGEESGEDDWKEGGGGRKHRRRRQEE
jgi:hypothetical protein